MRKIVIVVSDVRDSVLYRSIFSKLSEETPSLYIIFMGEQACEFIEFTRNLNCQVEVYEDLNKSNGIKSLFLLRREIVNSGASRIILLGQKATVAGLLGTVGIKGISKIYMRNHTSANRVERRIRGIFYDWISNRLSEKIIVPNQNTFNYLLREEHVPEKKLEKIYYGIKPMEPSRKKANKKIGVISRISNVKGLEYSFSAVAKLMRSDFSITFYWAGGGANAHEFISKFFEESLRDRVFVTEYTSNIQDFYDNLDIFIHCPINGEVEAFGLVYLEALSSGCACVFTISGIANEVCVNNQNCLVASYQSSESIYLNLVKLTNDLHLARNIGETGRQVIGQFDLVEQSKIYSKFLLN
jgi:glycosyltransferase involved in cell wall biosynthesis